jgi:hypothetical protein
MIYYFKPTKEFTKRFSKMLAVKIDEELQFLIEFLYRSIIFRSMAVHSSVILHIFGRCWKTWQCTSYLPNTLVWTCTEEVLDFYLGRETGHPDWGVPWSSLSAFGQTPRYNLYNVTIVSFQILSKTCHPTQHNLVPENVGKSTTNL